MKPFVILGLWTVLGWDIGAWAETLSGIPAAVGIVIGLALGAVLAIEARRRIAGATVPVPQAAAPASSLEVGPALDRAA